MIEDITLVKKPMSLDMFGGQNCNLKFRPALFLHYKPKVYLAESSMKKSQPVQ